MTSRPRLREGAGKGALAGALALVVLLAGCSKADAPAVEALPAVAVDSGIVVGHLGWGLDLRRFVDSTHAVACYTYASYGVSCVQLAAQPVERVR